MSPLEILLTRSISESKENRISWLSICRAPNTVASETCSQASPQSLELLNGTRLFEIKQAISVGTSQNSDTDLSLEAHSKAGSGMQRLQQMPWTVRHKVDIYSGYQMCRQLYQTAQVSNGLTASTSRPLESLLAWSL